MAVIGIIKFATSFLKKWFQEKCIFKNEAFVSKNYWQTSWNNFASKEKCMDAS